ncbi:MAG: hypothetical protein J6R07_03625, partial [Bacteroidaceae bacterium]|nr:hypothetical protein [Bacteroidaceae bacterium]
MKLQYSYILLIAAILATAPIHATAGNYKEESKEAVYIERISVTAGEVFEIPVMFRNENTYSAFQCDIELPEGITFEKDEYGDYCIYPESGR